MLISNRTSFIATMNVLGDTKTATMKKKTDVVEMRGKKEIINDNFTGKLDLFI